MIAILKTIAATLFWILWPWHSAPLPSEKSSSRAFSTSLLTEQPEQAEQGKPLMQFWQAQIPTREIKTTQTKLFCLSLLCSPWWKISKQLPISEQTEWNDKIWRYFHSSNTPTWSTFKGKGLVQHLHLQCQKRDPGQPFFGLYTAISPGNIIQNNWCRFLCWCYRDPVNPWNDFSCYIQSAGINRLEWHTAF